MTELFLTAYDGSILGPIAKALGWCMDKIYIFMATTCHIESIALTIILFTLLIYLLMFPLTYKQQKFSVLTRKMQPEMKVIQEKYKGKRDQASMQAQQEETQMIYDKYGVSPTGSCAYMLIQMPILFALYRVFFNVPAYIPTVKSVFSDLVNGIMATDGFATKMQTVYENSGVKNIKVDFSATDSTALGNYIIDLFYKIPTTGWDTIREAFPNLTSSIDAVAMKLDEINYLFVLNVSDTPLNLLKSGWADKSFALMICALLIPVISYGSQILNIKLMPTSDSGNPQMDQQMRTMNLIMPLMSLFITFTVPVGLGIYWAFGGIVRFVQQFFLNKHFDKIDLDAIIEKNKEKAAEKAEKRGIRQAQIYEAARMSTKSTSMASKATVSADIQKMLDEASETRSKAVAGSMAAKANLVKEYNEKNNK